jgi:putative RecB family exonuclease
MSTADVQTEVSSLPRLSPSRLEAWDRCPAAYRFEYVLQLPQPIADQRPRLLGTVAHVLLEAYLREAVTARTPPAPAWLPALAQSLAEGGTVAGANASLVREALALVIPWLARQALPLEHVVTVEDALAMDAAGRLVEWNAPEAFIRGRLDLVTIQGCSATVLDWKSGWVSEDEEDLRVAWAPGLYAALLWAWAPRLEDVTVEYHYLRTSRVIRVKLTPEDAAETLAWARALSSRIARELSTPDDPKAFPPRPSTACGICPWVNRCPAGQAALEAIDEAPIPDHAEASRMAGLLLVAEGRVGRLRERLKLYLQDREPLNLDGLELGFFPTKGRYDAEAVFRAATEAGWDPWPLLSADGRALAALLNRRPDLERHVAFAWNPSPPWFGHRKAKSAKGVRGSANVPAQAAEVRRERHPVSAKSTVPHEG